MASGSFREYFVRHARGSQPTLEVYLKWTFGVLIIVDNRGDVGQREGNGVSSSNNIMVTPDMFARLLEVFEPQRAHIESVYLPSLLAAGIANPFPNHTELMKEGSNVLAVARLQRNFTGRPKRR